MQATARAFPQPRQFFFISGTPILISGTSPSAVLPREVNFGVHDAHVPRERVAARKGFFLLAERAARLLLADVVDRVLVPREIVRPREDGVARLSRSWIDALALVRPRLRVALHQLGWRHAGSNSGSDVGRGPVHVALVLLQLLGRREALRAIVVRAAVRSGVGAGARLRRAQNPRRRSRWRSGLARRRVHRRQLCWELGRVFGVSRQSS